MIKTKSVLFSVLLLVLSPLLISSTKGGIKGTVVDNDNNPLESAKVTITSVEYPSTQFTLLTKANGEFIQIGLEPGYYRVVCEKEGFVSKEEQVRVPINEIIDTILKLNPLKEQIKVKEVPGQKESKQAYQFYQEGKYEEALTEYKKAIKKNPEEVTNYYNLGVIFMALDRDDEAIEAFKETIGLDQKNFSALKFLGQLYAKKNESQEAESYLSQAAELSEKDPELFYNLGVIRMNTAQYPEAIEAFQKAIACDANYIDAYYQLGLLFINQHQPKEANSIFERFLEIRPEDPRAPNVKKILEMIKKKNPF